jgi:hypothetical protein
MHRRRLLVSVVVALGALSVNFVGAAPAAQALVARIGPFTVPATGGVVSINVPAGVWLATATGTYKYDDLPTTSYDLQAADAFCSTASPYGDGLYDTVLEPDGYVDQIAAAFGVPFAPSSLLSPWVPLRYIAIVEPPTLNGFYFKDPLELQINHNLTAWAALIPTGFDGVTVACDTTTHTYNSVFVSNGARPTDFQIYDLYYGDNVGSLQVTLTQVL